MGKDIDLKALFDLVQHNWHKPIGLILAYSAAILFEIIMLASVDASCITYIIVYSFTALCITISWFYSNRIPKTPKNLGTDLFKTCQWKY